MSIATNFTGPQGDPNGTAATGAGLSPAEADRYARHLALPGVGLVGQLRLRQARVLLVGAGGLGSPAALYLAAAGVGTLGVIDPDVVERSNLQRQVLHGTAASGRLKVESATERLRDLNPHVGVEPHALRLTAENAAELVARYEVVVDGSDNFATRYALNDACVQLGKPLVHGAVQRWDGQVAVFWAARGPCYRCLFPAPPPPELAPSCAEAGVLGVLPGIVGTVQANETLKLLLGTGELLLGRLLLVDALGMRFREMRFGKNPACPSCNPNAAAASEPFPSQPMSNEIPEIGPAELKERLDRGDPLVVVDVREPHEWEVGNLGAYGARLIPLGELPSRIDEVPADAEVVLMCRSGGRSGRALEFLRAHGRDRLLNLRGGILGWSAQVDPSIPQY